MYHRILVPLDGSPTSSRGLDEALQLAILTGANVRVLHVLDDLLYANGFETCAVYATDVLAFARQTGARILEAGQARAANAGLKVETLLIERVSPRLADVVAEQVEAWNADLIVIGTHGRRGVGRMLLGSDAEQIMRTSTVPVLLVRAPEGAGDAPSTKAATNAMGIAAETPMAA